MTISMAAPATTRWLVAPAMTRSTIQIDPWRLYRHATGISAAIDNVSGIEDFIGSDFDDDIDGSDDANLMKGGDGNDNLWGGAGNDTIYGEDGDDYLFGGTGANIIDGGNGNDHIHAGGGNYNDVVTGGAGADTFHWQVDVVSGHDIITDYDPLTDALELLNPYGNGSANVFVNTSADGDVLISFENSLGRAQRRPEPGLGLGPGPAECRLQHRVRPSIETRNDLGARFPCDAPAGIPAGASSFCRML